MTSPKRVKFDEKLNDPFTGGPLRMSRHHLPTLFDVLRYFQLVRNQKHSELKHFVGPAIVDVINEVIPLIIEIWESVKLVHLDKKNIYTLIKRAHEKHLKMVEKYKKSGDADSFEIADYRREGNCLFDIFPCKSYQLSCTCDICKSHNHQSLEYLHDQRNDREAQMPKIPDPPMDQLSSASSSPDHHLIFGSSSSEMGGESSSSGYRPHLNDFALEDQNRVSIPNYATECIRYNVSKEAASALATALLVDYEIVTHDNLGNIIDKAKIRRAMDKVRANAIEDFEEFQNANPIKCLSYDGKIDISRVKSGKFSTTNVSESHYCLVQNPGIFIGFVAFEKHASMVSSTIGSIYFVLYHFYVSRLQKEYLTA